MVFLITNSKTNKQKEEIYGFTSLGKSGLKYLLALLSGINDISSSVSFSLSHFSFSPLHCLFYVFLDFMASSLHATQEFDQQATLGLCWFNISGSIKRENSPLLFRVLGKDSAQACVMCSSKEGRGQDSCECQPHQHHWKGEGAVSQRKSWVLTS